MAKFNIRDEASRKNAIKGFYTGEALERKVKARKWFAIYKDQIKPYIQKSLEAEISDYQAIIEMMNRSTAVNILKKIINKKACVYLRPVKRSVAQPKEGEEKKKPMVERIYSAIKAFMGGSVKKDPEEQTAQVETLSRILNRDTLMKKINRTVELHKNCMVKTTSYKLEDETYSIRKEILHPGQYDVIEDENDPTKPYAIILCDPWQPPDMKVPPPMVSTPDGAKDTRSFAGSVIPVTDPQIVKDSPMPATGNGPDAAGPTEDELRNMVFVWWTKEYHFVTDGLGKMKTELMDEKNQEGLNPIGCLPFTSYNKDQEGRHFAIGGDDIADGTILLNKLLTDLNYIMFFHGVGIFYMIGPGVPSKIRLGAQAAITLDTQGKQGNHSVGFASANPPVDSHLKNAEQLVATLLSTNDLEPSAVATRLTAETATSGIHELISKSSLTSSIEDEQSLYREGEQKDFRVEAKWVNYLIANKLACEALQLIGSIDENILVQVDFEAPKAFVSDKEKIENWGKRLEIGVNTLEDIIAMDHPDWSEEQVKEQAEKCKAMKAENAPDMDPDADPDADPAKPKPGEKKPPEGE